MTEENGTSLWKDKRLRTVVAVAILVHLVALGYLAKYPRGIFAKGDAVDYYYLGQNLLQYRMFGFFTKERGILPEIKNGSLVLPSLAVGQKQAFFPDPYRTPGYPLLLSLIFGLGGGAYAAIVVQSFLSLVTLWLTVVFATWLFQQPALAWRVALLAAFEPLNLIYSHQLMSDSFFTLLLLASIWLYLKLLLTPDLPLPWVCAILAGLLLGSAILTRPVAIYFPVVLVTWLLVYQFCLIQTPVTVHRPLLERTAVTEPPTGRLFLRRWQSLALLAIATILTISPWMIRNYLIFDHFLISTSASHNLLINTGAQIETSLRFPEKGASYWDVRRQLETELTDKMVQEGLDASNEVERAVYFRKWTVGIIKDHPLLALKFYLKGLLTQLFSDVPSFFELMGFTREQRYGWGALMQQGLRPALAQYFGPNWYFWAGAAVPLIAYDLAVYLLALAGLVALCRSRSWFLLLVLVSVIGYFWAVSAIIGLPRYRLPAMPCYLILAAWGWYCLWGSPSTPRSSECSRVNG